MRELLFKKGKKKKNYKREDIKTYSCRVCIENNYFRNIRAYLLIIGMATLCIVSRGIVGAICGTIGVP